MPDEETATDGHNDETTGPYTADVEDVEDDG